MKKIVFLIIAVVSVWMTSCTSGYKNIEEYATSETVYPGKFDTIVASIGYNRIELDLLKANFDFINDSTIVRKPVPVPTEQINLGKAMKTVVEVEGEDAPRVWDYLLSRVSIDGLTQSRLYRFKVYTEDEFGNKSVPQEIAEVPFTAIDVEVYDDVPDPKISPSPFSATFSWLSISSPLMQYAGMKYEYHDMDNVIRKGELKSDEELNFNMQNLEGEMNYSCDVYVHVIPFRGNVPIIDTIDLKRTYQTTTLNEQTYIDWCKDKARKVASVGWTQGNTVFWQAESDPTQIYSVVKYTDYTDPGNPVEATVTALRSDVITVLPGAKSGQPITIYSIYQPPGSIAEVPTNIKGYTTLAAPNGMIDIDRTFWTNIYTSVQPATDGNPQNGRPPQDACYDGAPLTVNSFLSMSKPSKSSGGSNNTAGGGRTVYFVLDMGYTTTFNCFYWIHRVASGDGQGLMWWGVKLYGCNTYRGLRQFLNPVSAADDPDTSNWVLIKDVNFGADEKGNLFTDNKPPLNYNPVYAPTNSSRQSPVYDLPACNYRYVKVALTRYDLVNNSNIGFNSFNLCYKIQ
jgi:hypothetical protein